MEEQISIKRHKIIEHITISMNEKGAKLLRSVLKQIAYLNLSDDEVRMVHRMIANLEAAIDEV